MFLYGLLKKIRFVTTSCGSLAMTEKAVESQADSATTAVARHALATHKINGGVSLRESPTLKVSSEWGIAKGERATSQFKPLPLS